MTWEQIQGKWKQIEGSIRSRWGRLSGDDVNFIAGQKDRLIGKLQERYGIAKEEALRQIDEWISSLSEEGEVQEPPQRKAG
jgi:uncharacterized protein YjbJ (UPF0337 family)